VNTPDQRAWDRQIDADFGEGGRLASVAEEVRNDIRAGRLQGSAVIGRTTRRFRKHFDAPPPNIISARCIARQKTNGTLP